MVWTCFTASGPGWQNIIDGAMSFEINQQILKENVRTSKSQEKVGHAGRQQPLSTQVIPAKNSQKRINMIFGLNMSKFCLLLNRTSCRKFIWANMSEAMSKSSSKLLFKNDQDFLFSLRSVFPLLGKLDRKSETSKVFTNLFLQL